MNLLTDEWTFAAPRPEVAPAHARDESVRRAGTYSLTAGGRGNDACFGWWRQTVVGIEPSRMYRFRVWLRTENIERLWENVIVRVYWLSADGSEAGKNFVHLLSDDGDWRRLEATMRAPDEASSAEVQLFFRWSAYGRVWWADPSFEMAEDRASRPVTLAVVRLRPGAPTTSADNIRAFGELIDQAGSEGVDAICLPEYVTHAGGVPIENAAAPIPGPHTDALGEFARRNGLYVVAGLVERAGRSIFNSAVLLDRDGAVVGKYRKTHLAFAEAIEGVAPGDAYPVFSTDFGCIGIEICYDNFFPEVARILALQGAEVIFLPIWGDLRDGDYCWRVTARARAIDNGVYVAASIYDGPSLIADPLGHILADSGDDEGLFVATVNLAEAPKNCPWLRANADGTWRNRLAVERRPHTYRRLLGY